ncbi:MAG: hypothetical protein ACK5KP_10520 [Paludibacteraceae bacterium]
MQKNKQEIFSTMKDVVSFVSTFIFIIFSAILYFAENNTFFFFPLILYTANLFMLVEMFVIFKKDQELKTRKNRNWLLIQVGVNLLGIVVSYYAYRYR